MWHKKANIKRRSHRDNKKRPYTRIKKKRETKEKGEGEVQNSNKNFDC